MRIALVALVAVTACKTEEEGVDSPWPDPVIGIETKDGATATGNLSDGQTLSLDWADQASVACWPGTEDTNFQGKHVLYGLAEPMPANSTLTITLTPGSNTVDVSLYAYQLGTTRYDVPPDVPSAVSCEAGFDQANDSNPGEAETVTLTTTGNPYNVLIGVAGTAGQTSGAFTLTLDLE